MQFKMETVLCKRHITWFLP